MELAFLRRGGGGGDEIFCALFRLYKGLYIESRNKLLKKGCWRTGKKEPLGPLKSYNGKRKFG